MTMHPQFLSAEKAAEIFHKSLDIIRNQRILITSAAITNKEIKMNAIELLNKICKGWGESPSGSGMLVNPCESGGIIDKAYVSNEWFVIFNDDRTIIEGLESREEAIEAFAAASIVSD